MKIAPRKSRLQAANEEANLETNQESANRSNQTNAKLKLKQSREALNAKARLRRNKSTTDLPLRVLLLCVVIVAQWRDSLAASRLARSCLLQSRLPQASHKHSSLAKLRDALKLLPFNVVPPQQAANSRNANSSQLQWSSRLQLQFAAANAQLSFQLWPPINLQAIGEQQLLDAHLQLPFSYVCGGWRNSVGPPAHEQPPAAYWQLDARRRVLVAKFTYARNAFPPRQLEAREAHLTSPMFALPVPYFNANASSAHFKACKLQFASYSSVPSLIEVQLTVVLASQNGSSATPSVSSPPQASKVHFFALSPKLRAPKTTANNLALASSAAKLWQTHAFALPPELALLGNAFFAVDVAASPTLIDSSVTYRPADSSVLNGVAITNLTLSAECFGDGVAFRGEQRVAPEGALASDERAALLLLDKLAVELHANSQLSKQQASLAAAVDLSSVDYEAALANARSVESSELSDTYDDDDDAPRLAKWPLFKLARRALSWLLFVGVALVACLVLLVVCIGAYFWRLKARGRAEPSKLFAPIDRFVFDLQQRVEFSARASNAHKDAKKPKNLANLSLDQCAKLQNIEMLENPNYAPSPCNSPLASFTEAIRDQIGRFALDRQSLELKEKLGEGAFGAVYRGCIRTSCASVQQSPNCRQLLQAASTQSKQSSKHCKQHASLQCAVKTLTEDRVLDFAEDFVMEAINLSFVEHRNIVRLLGVCLETRPLFIVMELLEGGNVRNFVINKRFHTVSTAFVEQAAACGNRQAEELVCIGDLLGFALDIARGCDYLQNKSFIHRDVAARNCLLTRNRRQLSSADAAPGSGTGSKSLVASLTSKVADVGSDESQDLLACAEQNYSEFDLVQLNGFANSGMVAKLADFGMTRDVFAKDYYKISQREIPVRWMPPECFENGITTSKCDVWSFGILLWELFSLGVKPYNDLPDNKQVVDFIKARAASGLRSPQLPKPDSGTPDELYELMCDCWAREPNERPQFCDVVRRLVAMLSNEEVLGSSLPQPFQFEFV